MKKYEEKEVVKIDKVLTALKCDECKNDILQMETYLYYRVITGHQLWGNDSMDSIDNLDFCSYVCLIKNMKEYWENPIETMRYDIDCKDIRELKV